VIEFLITSTTFMFLATFIVMFVLLELKRYVRKRKNSYDNSLEKRQILQEKMEQKKRESEL